MKSTDSVCVFVCGKDVTRLSKSQSINESQAQFAEPLTSKGISTLNRGRSRDRSFKGLPTSLPPHILTDSLPCRLIDGLGVSVRVIQTAAAFQGFRIYSRISKETQTYLGFVIHYSQAIGRHPEQSFDCFLSTLRKK